jgi:peptide/nickel transport system substrate-binding protein
MRLSTSHWMLCIALVLSLFSCKREPAVDFKRTDNSVIMRLEADPDRLNPVLSTTAYARAIYEQVFSYLVIQDPVTLEFIPQLAAALPERSETPEGLIAYTYEIRKEAEWDNGTPVTANDYIFTLKAALNPRVPAQRIRPYLAFIKNITVDPSNPKRFTAYTEKYILSEEAIGSALPVLPEYQYDPEGLLRNISITQFLDPEGIAALAESDERLTKFAEIFGSEKLSREPSGVIGSGPYRLDSWETGQRLVLTKKDKWWGSKLAKNAPALEAFPDQLVFKVITDNVAALNALKAEEIDAVSTIDPKDFLELQQTPLVNERYNLHAPLALISYFIYVNTTNPKLADKKVRQALAHTVNPDEIIENVFYGFGQRIIGPAHPSVPYYNKDLALIPYNIEKAKALLAEAGWSDSDNNGFVDKEIDGKREELKLTYLMSAGNERSKNIALLLQDNAKKAGINLELIAKETTAVFDDLKKRNYDLGGGGRSLPNTLWDPRQNWHTEGDNRTGFGTPETDALIDEIRVTIDPAVRTPKYRKLQSIIYDEQPEIYLLAPQDRIAVHKRFEVEITSIYPGYNLNRMRLKK